MKLQQFYITRFFAAICVVIYHFGQATTELQPEFFKGILSFGNEAVNYFFSLSGFIMAIAYYRHDSSGLINKERYWINRIARIYPAYIVAVLLVVAYAAIKPDFFSSLASRLPLEIVLLQSWIGKSSINFPGWSLSVEIFFYLCFPFVMSFLSNKSDRWLALAAIFVYIVFLGLNYQATIYTEQGRLSTSFMMYFPVFHFATFLAGVVSGMIFLRHQNWIMKHQAATKYIGYTIMLALLFIYLLPNGLVRKLHHNGLLAPVYAFFFIAFSIPSNVNRILSHPFAVFLGEISYGIYILQFPVWLHFKEFLHLKSPLPLFWFIGYLVVLIALSAGIYVFIEKKAQLRLRKIRISSPGLQEKTG